MNDRSISLAVTLAAVLGTPIAAGAQEQPEPPQQPQEPDLAQATAPDPIKAEMSVAKPQTPPTMEPATAVEFSAPAPLTRPRSITSGPPTFPSSRRDRPVVQPAIARKQISPATATSQSPTAVATTKPVVVVVESSPSTPSASFAPPAPSLSSAPTVERTSAIEFSAPSPASTSTRPVIAQNEPTVVPDAAPSAQPLQEQLSTLEQRQRQLEQEIDRLKQNLATPKTAPVSITEDQPQNFTISATGVFFKPRNSSPFDYAIEDAGNALAINGKLQTAEYDRGAGVRIGLTYQPPSSALDIAVAYTFLNTSGDDRAIAPTNGFLFSTLSSPRQNERAGIASASADLNYNNTDLEVGYKFRVGKSLGLRLFGGLKFASIDQDLDVRYDQFDYTNGRLKIGNDFSGFGPRLGTETRLLLGSGFSLFGRGAASLLIGDLNSSYRETDNDGTDLIANLQRTQSSHTVPVLEAAIGLDWQASLGKRSKINLSAGYEYQHWFNTSEDLRFVNASNPGLLTRSSGDLSLGGFFVKGGLSFEF